MEEECKIHPSLWTAKIFIIAVKDVLKEQIQLFEKGQKKVLRTIIERKQRLKFLSLQAESFLGACSLQPSSKDRFTYGVGLEYQLHSKQHCAIKNKKII